MSEKFLTVTDAALVETRAYREAATAVALACKHNAIVVLVGPTGTGKTRAVNDAFAALGEPPRIKWKPQHATNDKQTVVALLQKATGVNYGADRRYDSGDRLLEFFTERPKPTDIDEAHNLLPRGLEALRHIYKDDATEMPLVLTGAPELIDTIHRNEQFERLIATYVKFVPLTAQEVVSTMPHWHWLYERADEYQLLRINEYASGNFGRWALFTNVYLDAMDNLARAGGMHDDLIEFVIDKIRRRARTQQASRDNGRKATAASTRRTRRAKAPTRWS